MLVAWNYRTCRRQKGNPKCEFEISVVAVISESSVHSESSEDKRMAIDRTGLDVSCVLHAKKLSISKWEIKRSQSWKLSLSHRVDSSKLAVETCSQLGRGRSANQPGDLSPASQQSQGNAGKWGFTARKTETRPTESTRLTPVLFLVN
ncbi:hypothetical protein MUK42_13299 [Musa troglodytarum]|uniref:Uncharacterized protein n=1 Tax=Musa troglodytarum TaxID=320322 RepID=A0A9E7HT70_9LILI|nr:hypothetical protein MUK42_13299 [Musa troglodytarum]